MTQHVPILSQPKKASGFWTPWGNVRVPDLDAALEQKAVMPAKLPRKTAPTDRKPAAPSPRG